MKISIFANTLGDFNNSSFEKTIKRLSEYI